jgi:quercetin dioxygenase-like cupin family protein
MPDEPLVVQAEQGPPFRMPYGDDIRCLVAGAATGERYSLHHRTAPPGAASYPHSHQRVIEAFYVIDGQFEFDVGGRKFTGGAGTYVHVPAGVSHAWRVASDDTAHAVILFSPSVDDGFFGEVDAEVKSPGGPSRERLAAINAKYGLD